MGNFLAGVLRAIPAVLAIAAAAFQGEVLIPKDVRHQVGPMLLETLGDVTPELLTAISRDGPDARLTELPVWAAQPQAGRRRWLRHQLLAFVRVAEQLLEQVHGDAGEALRRAVQTASVLA